MLEQSKIENMKLRDLNEQRKREVVEMRETMEREEANPMKLKNLEDELKLVREQYNQAKKEIDSISKTKDYYKSMIEKSSNENIAKLNELVRNSLRPGDNKAMKDHILNDLARSGGSGRDSGYHSGRDSSGGNRGGYY